MPNLYHPRVVALLVWLTSLRSSWGQGRGLAQDPLGFELILRTTEVTQAFKGREDICSLVDQGSNNNMNEMQGKNQRVGFPEQPCLPTCPRPMGKGHTMAYQLPVQPEGIRQLQEDGHSLAGLQGGPSALLAFFHLHRGQLHNHFQGLDGLCIVSRLVECPGLDEVVQGVVSDLRRS